MIGVFIADDHPVVRQGIRQIVAATDDITVVDEATTGHETLQRLADVQCDLVLLDLSLPDIDGLDLLKQLKREHPQRPILILTMHSEDQFALRALKAGASGYLTKESAPAELVGAVRKVVAGGRYIGDAVDCAAADAAAERITSIRRLSSASETAGPRAAVRSRISGAAPHRRRTIDTGHLHSAVAQLEDRQHLSGPPARQDGDENLRRTHGVRRSPSLGRLATT